MSTKNIFISINILDEKYLYGIYVEKEGNIIDIIININDFKISLYDIIQSNNHIELSYNNKTQKYINFCLLYRNSGIIELHYDKYNISQINNLLIIFNFVINNFFKKIINKMYSLSLTNNNLFITKLKKINNIKKINCMRLYKSLYYMNNAIY